MTFKGLRTPKGKVLFKHVANNVFAHFFKLLKLHSRVSAA